MNYEYGAGADEVDPFFSAKRSWSKVKDKIVGDYVACYLKTVHNLKRNILLVDGFAGPGRFGDGSDGSPLLICKAIRSRHKESIQMSCLFADARPMHRQVLTNNLSEYIDAGVCTAPLNDCGEAIAQALNTGTDSTVFFYLDPYGIKDLEFEMVRQIYEREPNRSTEVLINFNFRTFMRMSGNWGYGDSANSISQKVKASKVETVNRVMGGDYWQEIITNPALNKIDREDAVMKAYLRQVQRYFKYAFAIPVKERGDNGNDIPDDELAHYHLIFGTRSSKAVVYMNDVALLALEPYFAQFKDGLLFDFTPDRYQSVGIEAIKDAIVESVKAKALRRPEIYEAVIPKFFMQQKKKEYRAAIDDLAFKELRLFPDPGTMKRHNQLNDDTALSAQPWCTDLLG